MNNAKKQRQTQNGKDQRSLQEDYRYQGNISCKDKHNKRNGKDLAEVEEIKKRCKELTEKLHKKGLIDLDKHNGVCGH